MAGPVKVAGTEGVPDKVTQRLAPGPQPFTALTHNCPVVKFAGNCKVTELELGVPTMETPVGGVQE